ncbi:hypothetical protein A2697_00045 [Candidatus Curtissbacteria bacterium RIFCSPHIGHO2_01_FULL_41_44]|uniref:LytR/CpsA/Psr regulator C-terminal domain-containing protein n=1 Tax=Candidatus Curtissbacteria bacterium RIFCSPLOWO2_01_FULL_42_50 TaxID=1797730 RepID=A0A1F5H748_9BACT|nr:MAG: hypothetical protein A3C33_01890 [Candidatus Curtissbacteria bacterium RIFCSPHIGHO2_02_FULL_42_58]OGD94390.1 MAG: hypothetical protein A2697_00045 [Candidatus Curtissbacteria bacterium RIFCSPHIGHO2_01_FULL_41_44]OGD97664.1 MAG: hypothetical protein A3E71_00970 [Candidatus Curtissbacteria bacterium RIFCSPHIGHO2_12_FULL_42_33]OGD99895.1 MAG: hypothetical protein A3B54_00045 [Candidatus Curtissbacteria bacterium RIFCSPLOWO2_01_FULL_42_50]OGE02754.1 MAG: hypothetical protein A3G16_03010 [Ca
MEEQQTPTAGSPIYQESQEKNAKWLWILIVLIIVGALVFAFVRGIGPLARFKGEFREEASPTPVEFFSPSPTPEATGGAELDKSEPKIRVLNGSGQAGIASSVKDFLEGKGYKVVSIGNAASYDFKNTVLRFKESFKNFEEVLTSDLEDKYSVTTAGEVLEATDSADIEVTVGAK